MKKLPDPRRLDLLTWQPPMATVITHPAKWRAIWVPVVEDVATAIIAEPEKARMYLTNVPLLLRDDLRKAGANDHEGAREVAKYQQALLAELGRRRHRERQGPGAA